MNKAYQSIVAVIMLSVFAMITFISTARAYDWESSPLNWENSPNNWQNSPNNWQNGPNNWQNSPNRFGNERIIRDNQGQPDGYVVPRQDGGANIYNLDGTRRGYVPRR